jgi:hypothetical protein
MQSSLLKSSILGYEDVVANLLSCLVCSLELIGLALSAIEQYSFHNKLASTGLLAAKTIRF